MTSCSASRRYPSAPTSCGRSMLVTTLSSHVPFRCWKAQRLRPAPPRGRARGAGAGADAEQIRRAVARSRHKAPVIGITGTGGAGKSSLTDELLTRLAGQLPQAQIAVVGVGSAGGRRGGGGRGGPH